MELIASPPPSIPAFVGRFGGILRDRGLHPALALLNATAPYRFTGVYCFEPEWVRSFVLYDRENPTLEVGADVPMRESYCMFTARDSTPLVIEDAMREERWYGHAARETVLSYVAVTLFDSSEVPVATLCHFDFASRELPTGTMELLAAVREPVEAHLRASGIIAHPETHFG
jgi:hypothetical protein